MAGAIDAVGQEDVALDGPTVHKLVSLSSNYNLSRLINNKYVLTQRMKWVNHDENVVIWVAEAILT